MFFSEMNQRIFKLFFANPILFRRCAGSVLQNAMKKIAHNQTRDPDSSADFSKRIHRPVQQGRTHHRIAQIAKILDLRSRKIPKILRKNDFRKKNIFFHREKSNANTSFPAQFWGLGVLGTLQQHQFCYFSRISLPGTCPSSSAVRSLSIREFQ